MKVEGQTEMKREITRNNHSPPQLSKHHHQNWRDAVCGIDAWRIKSVIWPDKSMHFAIVITVCAHTKIFKCGFSVFCTQQPLRLNKSNLNKQNPFKIHTKSVHAHYKRERERENRKTSFGFWLIYCLLMCLHNITHLLTFAYGYSLLSF